MLKTSIVAFLLSLYLFHALHGQKKSHEKYSELKKLCSKAKELYEVNPDSSLLFSNRVFHEAKKSGYDSLAARAAINKAVAYSYKSQFDSAFSYNYIALDLANTVNDTISIIDAYNNLGIDFYINDQWQQATKNFNKVKELSIKIGDSVRLGHVYNNLGLIEDLKGNPVKELDFYIKSKTVFSEIDEKEGLANATMNIGTILNSQGKYDQAILEFAEALKLYKELGYKTGESQILTNMAETYANLQVYDLALKYLDQSLAIAEKYDLTTEKVYILGLKHKFLSIKGNYAKAYQVLKEYEAISSEIYNTEKSQQIALLNKQFETEQNEKKIAILEKENILQQARAEKEKNYFYLSIAGLLIVVLFAIYLYTRFKLKSKSAFLLSQKNRALQELDLTKNKLFAIVSHDLKNPVSAFRSMTDALVENYEALSRDKTFSYLQKMNRNALAVENQLNDLLLWASQQIKKEELSISQINFETLTQEVFELISPMADQKQITLDSRIDPDFSLTSHPELLKTVLRNLLTNGIKFTENQGIVTLEAKMKDGFPEISIKDTGIGMSEQEVGLLFDIDKSVTIGSNSAKGTGIGLSICKDIINKLNGEISVRSRVNEGTVFSLRFSS